MPKHIVVIGGGLAGTLAALRLSRDCDNVTVIDESVPAANGRLGGFAEFSGAKFSMLPAGQGLIRVAGSASRVQAVSREVLNELGLDDLCAASMKNPFYEASDGLSLRSYESILVSPTRMAALLSRLTERLGKLVSLENGRVVFLSKISRGWITSLSNGRSMVADAVIYAGGRTGGNLLELAGAKPQVGKGIDVGVRMNFPDGAGLARLRRMGADAKFLSGRCRTFCLNHPGNVYRYPFDGYSIPGGVVAGPSVQSANVGILLRLGEKARVLQSTREVVEANLLTGYDVGALTRTCGLADKNALVNQAWGSEVVEELEAFLDLLATDGLVDWSVPHEVLWPLLDWHWPVFALPNSFRTTQERLYVAGDSAGHARGLLQAAVAGWLAAEALVNETV